MFDSVRDVGRKLMAQLSGYGRPGATDLAPAGSGPARERGDGKGADQPEVTGRNSAGLKTLVRDLQRLLREVDGAQNDQAEAVAQWSPEGLRTLLRNNFPADEVIVVSNREPYIHQRTEEGVRWHRPASGLVTAVEPVMRACSGTWIAQGSGSADRDVVDEHDRVQVPPGSPSYTLRRIWLTEAEEQGYYYGFANEGLWPLCHVAHVRPVFRSGDWQCYQEINQRFADAVVKEAKTPDPIVLIHDYHFALAPAMIRKLLPDATIITFWHIPWPNFESFGICPWKEEILVGMLGSDILGFHTSFHCKNFIETVDRFVEARIEHETATIRVAGSLTYVNAYPISVAWPKPLDRELFPALRRKVRARHGLPPSHRLAIGVDRLDYTKGIVERIRAVERMMELHPEWVGQFTLVQIAAPTRSSLPEYQRFEAEVRQAADAVNQRFGVDGNDPILLLIEHHEIESVLEYFRAADVCTVTSLHDGMNLVSKEFVAAHDDDRGVLILSQFAGASRELLDALIVNPYHIDQVAEALNEALAMPEHEQEVRMRSLRHLVRDFNVYRWAGRMLLDAGKLRRRVRVEARINRGPGIVDLRKPA
ncbi:MAG: trehalose-6-phosphate synthase [Lautropia sp.]